MKNNATMTVQGLDILNKCLKTAFRIIKGEHISPLDNSFLYEQYPCMHFQAWQLRAEEAESMSQELMMEALGY